MDYPQTRTASPDERLMAAIRIIVRQELATVLSSGEPKDRLLTVAEAATFALNGAVNLLRFFSLIT